MTNPVFLGIDVGTSGVRGSCINLDGDELATFQKPLEIPTISGNNVLQQPEIWKQTTYEVILHLARQLKPVSISTIAIDGTSGTVLLCDDAGNPLSPALMYNDQSCQSEAREISDIAPSNSAAHGASSSLAKAMHLLKQHPAANHLCHQADWLAGTLTGRYDVSDENNCLKLGYDLMNNCWPQWVSKLGIPAQSLPRVQMPGTSIGPILNTIAKQLELSSQCRVVSGTTDSIAAFIATGAKETGDAVTSLGSTLVLKVISDQPIYSAELGIYSHRLGKQWLAGGASNSGGRVLLQHFSGQQLEQMTPQLHPDKETGLNYYPLPAVGERFPTNDPNLQPRLNPRPASDIEFFQGILEGIADIETKGYQRLTNLGAAFPKKVFTTGGGSSNAAWTAIRKHKLETNVIVPDHTQASYGAALLAKQGYEKTQKG